MAGNELVIDDELYDEEDTMKDRYLTFHLAGEDYGIEIEYVTEIIGIQKITGVPDMPEYVKGVINLRGKVIPVMDVRQRFNLEYRDYDERTCIIVVDIDGTPVGLVVDEVKEVMDIPESDVEPPPKSSSVSGNQFVQGMGKVGEDVKIILNVKKLLFDEIESLIETEDN
jgi:purine-binding chemotaxis protein CheW